MTNAQPITTPAPSAWQKRIEGEWHGRPAIFDAEGSHRGFSKVYRSSVYEGGKTTYTMNTQFDAGGDLQSRLEYADFAFGVIDSDRDRIYMGPDFYGAGRPFGALVDAHYYSPGWMLDLRTMVHVLPDNRTQVYSSLLFQGPTLYCVFNGIYKVAFDYHDNPDTQARIASHVESELARAARPHVLPAKQRGRWRGTLLVYDAAQQPAGELAVLVEHRPETLLRSRQTVTVEGAFNRKWSFTRGRHDNLHTYEGPDLYGNAISYGRALYTTQHFSGESFKIKGREFFIDADHTMSAVWQFYQSDQLKFTTFGLLHWEEE